MRVRFQADADLDGLLVRYVHLGIAAGCRGVYGGDPSNVALYDTPLRISKHYNGNCAALQIPLRHHVLVGRHEHFKSGFPGSFQ